MANIHSQFLADESLIDGQPLLRSMLVASEVSYGGNPDLRSMLVVIESAYDGNPRLRSEFLDVETAYGASPNLRSRLIIIEALQEILEPFMSNVFFPAMQGLAFDVSKKPVFSTKIAEHTSGGETATSYFQYPKWEFKLTYDYLPDLPKSVGDTDLHNLMGFFLARQGRWDTFLFQDPDGYSVTDGFQATMDGVTAQIKLVRGIGGYYETIGQLDQSIVTLAVYLAVDETFNVPATGPYTHTVTHAAAYHLTDSVTIGGVAATVGTGPGQYTVAAGVYTFNSADHGKAVDVRYRYLLTLTTDYTITMPNVIIFTSAPASGVGVYATFNYCYVCRFLEDFSEYTKFMDKLWNLSELGFRSIPQ
jgi:hypothetical protein